MDRHCNYDLIISIVCMGPLCSQMIILVSNSTFPGNYLQKNGNFSMTDTVLDTTTFEEVN